MATRPSPNANAPGKAKVLLVDDHAVVRQGLAELVDEQDDLSACGQAGDAEAALAFLRGAVPDVAVLDLSLPGRDGIELTRDIVQRHPEVPVLILSMHDESLYAERALRAGAKGYVMKREPADVVIEAIRHVLRGEIYVSRNIARQVLRQLSSSSSPEKLSPLGRLTDRELEIFRLIGQGVSVRDIAEKLFISARTVEAHREHIKQKLDLPSTNELLRYAVHHLLGEA